jgi:hypothetical protein
MLQKKDSFGISTHTFLICRLQRINSFFNYEYMRILLLQGILFLVCIAKSYSQISSKEEFNNYYRLSSEKLIELYGARGLSGSCDTSDYSHYGMPMDFLGQIEVSLKKAYPDQVGRIGVIFYSLAKDTFRIWLWRQSGLFVSKSLITRDELTKAEIALRQSLKVDELSEGRAPQKRGASLTGSSKNNILPLETTVRMATNLLLPPPIAQHLDGLHHLMIIPEYNIGQFPFYVLKPFLNDSYLIDSVSINFIPHLCNLLNFYENKQSIIGKKIRYTASNPLIIGNPSFSKNTAYQLPTLKGAEAEAQQVALVLHTSALLGKEATISAVKSHLTTADLLYFATHGFYDPEKMLDGSFLAFSPDAMNTTGLWSARDIQEQKINADIAILSACQTGVGKITGGGFIGIGRAFFIAGVSNTIISLWSVDDKSTKQLMITFMNEIQKDDYFFPARHLRAAILAYKRKDPDPAHWAPFMDFGFPF